MKHCVQNKAMNACLAPIPLSLLQAMDVLSQSIIFLKRTITKKINKAKKKEGFIYNKRNYDALFPGSAFGQLPTANSTTLVLSFYDRVSGQQPALDELGLQLNKFYLHLASTNPMYSSSGSSILTCV